MSRADGFGLQVYHVTDERSNGMRSDRIECLSKDHYLGGLPMISSDLITHDLSQHPFSLAAVELAVKGQSPLCDILLSYPCRSRTWRQWSALCAITAQPHFCQIRVVNPSRRSGGTAHSWRYR